MKLKTDNSSPEIHEISPVGIKQTAAEMISESEIGNFWVLCEREKE